MGSTGEPGTSTTPWTEHHICYGPYSAADRRYGRGTHRDPAMSGLWNVTGRRLRTHRDLGRERAADPSSRRIHERPCRAIAGHRDTSGPGPVAGRRSRTYACRVQSSLNQICRRSCIRLPRTIQFGTLLLPLVSLSAIVCQACLLRVGSTSSRSSEKAIRVKSLYPMHTV
jgi:hypothetical protein